MDGGARLSGDCSTAGIWIEVRRGDASVKDDVTTEVKLVVDIFYVRTTEPLYVRGTVL
jgi:hypothetical protein